MTRWANEDQWTALIEGAASRYGVPAPLVQSVIAVESGFRPGAYRAEPKIGDGSSGLMQILYGTAKSVGYFGPSGDSTQLTGLFDPATNIEYGTKYLAQQYRRAGNAAGAASAYNGGWRPTLGFGAPATKALSVVLARDSTTGAPIRTRNVPVGEYANQPYVDAVLDTLRYFESKRAATTGVTQFVTPTTEAGTVNPKLLAAMIGLLFGLLGIRFGRR